MKKLRDKTIKEISENNGLDFPLLSNIIEEKNSKAKIRATLEIIAKTLAGTLGPYGSTTIVQGSMHDHFPTKDGYDLMNRLTFKDQTSETVLDLVREIAQNQVLNVGDGSTSAIVVANSLYNALTSDEKSEFFKHVAPKDITNLLDDLAVILEKKLKEKAMLISEDLSELKTIATIATNNDPISGELIYEIYKKIGRYGFISNDITSRLEKDEFEIKRGIEWSAGYIEPYFANSYENKKIIHDKEPRVFLSDSVLTYDDIQPFISPVLGKVCGNEDSELIIVAPDYTEDVRIFFKNNRQKHLRSGKELIFTVVDIAQNSTFNRNKLDDLGLILGCEVFRKEKHNAIEFNKKIDNFIGRAEKAIITAKSTQIIGLELDGESLKKINEKSEELLKEIEELENKSSLSNEDNYKLYDNKRRLSSFKNSTATLKIGGRSLPERKSRERLYEDAIYASKSALKYGYISGGNLEIPRILNEESKSIVKELSKKYFYIESAETVIEEFLDTVKNAFLESYISVLNNSYFSEEKIKLVVERCLKENKIYNLKNHKYESVKETKVINSVDTDIQIMKSCFSIIGYMALSNQVLTLVPSPYSQI